MIRQVKTNPPNRSWCVFSEDGKKNLGCGPSEKWAKERLGQVEGFKERGQNEFLEGMINGIDLLFEPPAAPEDAPAELKKILQSSYEAATKVDLGDDPEKKARCASIAWSAVKKQFKQNDRNKWVRKNPISLGFCLDVEGLPFKKVTDNTYSKSVLSVGRWIHPLTGKLVDMTDEKLSRFKDNLLKFGLAKIKVPFPSRHSLEPTDNLGWWDPSSAQIADVDGKKHLVMSLTVTDTKAQEKVAEGSLGDVSVFYVPKHTIQTGEKLEDVILHVCATSYPVLNDQPTFKALIKDGLSGETEVSFLVYKQKTEEENMEFLEAVRKALGEDKMSDTDLLKKLEGLDIKALEEKAKKADEFEKLDLGALKKQAEELEALKKAETEKLIDSVHALSAEVGTLLTEEELKSLDDQSDEILKLQIKSLEAVAEAKGIKKAKTTKEGGEREEYLDYAARVLQEQGYDAEIKGKKIVMKAKE